MPCNRSLWALRPKQVRKPPVHNKERTWKRHTSTLAPNHSRFRNTCSSLSKSSRITTSRSPHAHGRSIFLAICLVTQTTGKSNEKFFTSYRTPSGLEVDHSHRFSILDDPTLETLSVRNRSLSAFGDLSHGLKYLYK